ncbi:phage tail protein [Salmonella enterica subsp. enterica serovar Weltevreden]|nr:phage tail protein [Salmonella enterica subsp. enterica serovar Weltevreden]
MTGGFIAQAPNGWWQVFERSGAGKIPTLMVKTRLLMYCAMRSTRRLFWR